MKKKLLVADDSVTIQKVVNLTFAGEDVAIEAVSDGEQALEKARSMRPDIVLADVFMPGRNGYQVCADIKNDPALSATPVVLMVGTFEAFDEAEAARVQANGRLTKPFDTSELIELVRSLTSATPAAEKGAVTALEQAPRVTAAAAGMRVKTPLVSTRSRESFLGNGRILDLFAPQMLATVLQPEPAPEPPPSAAPEPAPAPVEEAAPPIAEVVVPPVGATPTVIQFPTAKAADALAEGVELPDDFVNLVVDRVVRRLTPDVIREVAWEVVPEMAEAVIRKVLAEKNLPPQS